MAGNRRTTQEGQRDIRVLMSWGPLLSTEPRAGDEGACGASWGMGQALLPFLEASCLLVTHYVHCDCKYGFAFPNGRVG